MKKVLSFIIAVALLSSISCEKEKDTALSEYLLGEWKTPVMYIHSTLPAWYEIEISGSTYSVMITNGTSFIGWPNKSYSVNNANSTITIKTFNVEANDLLYKVTLTDDPDMMIWTTDEEGGINFIWERM